ncbi:MAG: DEAD/DEAH box helicase [Planctomycetota bacterium]
MELSQTTLFPEPVRVRPNTHLRYYQHEAVAATFKAWESHKRVLLNMATGTGKTVIFSEIAKLFQGRVLVLAHRDELISQTIDKLTELTGEAVGLEQASSYSGKERIVVGSVQTVCRKDRYTRMQQLGGFDLVILDEAHHYVAKTYKRAIDAFPNAYLLGVTATPDRGDKRALGQIVETCAYRFDILAGIDAGYLVPLQGHHVSIDAIDLSNVRTVAGDLNRSELDDAVCKGVEGIVKATLERWPDRKAIAFWPKKRSARLACERFNYYAPGIAECIDDDTPRDERRDIIARCRSGDIQILCNVLIATEGFDWPECSLIVDARPTKSRALYTQKVGRGTRTLSNTVDSVGGVEGAGQRRQFIADSPKPLCVIADFVGDAGRHDLRSPIDVLSGGYSEAEVKMAKKLAKDEGQGDPIDQLERARLELKAMAASMAASKVVHSTRRFDPFAVLDIPQLPQSWRDDQSSTPGQASYLKRYMKFSDKECERYGKRQASRLIEESERRRKAGLASFAQLKQLQKFGIKSQKITRARASDCMEYLQMNGWGRGPQFRHDKLRALAHGVGHQ